MRRPKCHDEDVLVKIITYITIAGSAADSRRRTEVINTCKTLDDLVEKLKKERIASKESDTRRLQM